MGIVIKWKKLLVSRCPICNLPLAKPDEKNIIKCSGMYSHSFESRCEFAIRTNKYFELVDQMKMVVK